MPAFHLQEKPDRGDSSLSQNSETQGKDSKLERMFKGMWANRNIQWSKYQNHHGTGEKLRLSEFLKIPQQSLTSNQFHLAPKPGDFVL